MISIARSEIAPERLRCARRSFHESIGAVRPPGLAELTRHVRHLTSGVVRLLAEPEAATRLWQALEPTRREGDLARWLPLVLDGAVGLTGADRGDLQILDPRSGALWLVVSSGFDRDLLDTAALLLDQRTACRQALQRGHRVCIHDIAEGHLFALHLPVTAAAGISALQCTPLRGATAQPVGVLSTYWDRPHRVERADHWLLDLHADLIGDRLCQMLTRREPPVPSPRAAHDEASSRSRAGPVAQSFPHHWFSPLMDELLASVWSTGRALDRARGTAGPVVGTHPLDPAAASVDAAVRRIRAFVLEHDGPGAERGWPSGSDPGGEARGPGGEPESGR